MPVAVDLPSVAVSISLNIVPLVGDRGYWMPVFGLFLSRVIMIARLSFYAIYGAVSITPLPCLISF